MGEKETKPGNEAPKYGMISLWMLQTHPDIVSAFGAFSDICKVFLFIFSSWLWQCKLIQPMTKWLSEFSFIHFTNSSFEMSECCTVLFDFSTRQRFYGNWITLDSNGLTHYNTKHMRCWIHARRPLVNVEHLSIIWTPPPQDIFDITNVFYCCHYLFGPQPPYLDSCPSSQSHWHVHNPPTNQNKQNICYRCGKSEYNYGGNLNRVNHAIITS